MNVTKFYFSMYCIRLFVLLLLASGFGCSYSRFSVSRVDEGIQCDAIVSSTGNVLLSVTTQDLSGRGGHLTTSSPQECGFLVDVYRDGKSVRRTPEGETADEYTKILYGMSRGFYAGNAPWTTAVPPYGKVTVPINLNSLFELEPHGEYEVVVRRAWMVEHSVVLYGACTGFRIP